MELTVCTIAPYTMLHYGKTKHWCQLITVKWIDKFLNGNLWSTIKENLDI